MACKRQMDLDNSTVTDNKKQKLNPDSKADSKASSKLKISNLLFETNRDTLSQCFNGASAITMPKRNGKFQGIAFVEYNTVEEAIEVKNSMHGHSIDGRNIRVGYSKQINKDAEEHQEAIQQYKQQQKDRSGRDFHLAQPSNALIVCNLPFDTTERNLKETFKGAQSVQVMVNKQTGRSKGVGFVLYKSIDIAIKAQKELNLKMLDGRPMKINFAKQNEKTGVSVKEKREKKPKNTNPPSKKLMIVKLNYDTKKETLEQLFARASHVNIAIDDKGESKGYGFVTFNDIEDAKLALKTMNGKKIDGNKIQINFALEEDLSDPSNDFHARPTHSMNRKPLKHENKSNVKSKVTENNGFISKLKL